MTYFEKLIKKAKEIKNPIKQVLAVSGSPRKGGNSDIIINQIISGLNTENIATKTANLRSIDFVVVLAVKSVEKIKFVQCFKMECQFYIQVLLTQKD